MRAEYFRFVSADKEERMTVLKFICDNLVADTVEHNQGRTVCYQTWFGGAPWNFSSSLPLLQ